MLLSLLGFSHNLYVYELTNLENNMSQTFTFTVHNHKTHNFTRTRVFHKWTQEQYDNWVANTRLKGTLELVSKVPTPKVTLGTIMAYRDKQQERVLDYGAYAESEWKDEVHRLNDLIMDLQESELLTDNLTEEFISGLGYGDLITFMYNRYE